MECDIFTLLSWTFGTFGFPGLSGPTSSSWGFGTLYLSLGPGCPFGFFLSLSWTFIFPDPRLSLNSQLFTDATLVGLLSALCCLPVGVKTFFVFFALDFLADSGYSVFEQSDRRPLCRSPDQTAVSVFTSSYQLNPVWVLTFAWFSRHN